MDFVHDEALSVQGEGGKVTGVTLAGAGAVACGAAVNAAGAWGAPEICASLGVELPIESRKRFTFVFECRAPIGPTPLTITETGVAFRSEGKGFISNVSPPPERDPVTKDVEIDHHLFDELIWPALASRVPAFEAIKPTGAWCCHYDYNTLDENLIIGRTPAYGNFYLAAGLLRPRPAAVPGGGKGALRAHHLRGVPHHRPLPLRLRTCPGRRAAPGGELLLSGPAGLPGSRGCAAYRGTCKHRAARSRPCPIPDPARRSEAAGDP